MMNYRTRLRDNLLTESKAYGYTLSIWGAGALLIRAFGLPKSIEVIGYIAGALAGFALLVVVAFGGEKGPLYDVEHSDTEAVIAASTIHVVATLGNVVLADALITRLSASLSGLSPLTFALVGAQVTVGYNLLLLSENVVARFLAE